MCTSNCGCASCGMSKVDGGTDPQVVGQLISSILYEGQASDNVIKEAYPEVMIFLDSKGLEPTESNIMENKEALLNAISNNNVGLEISSTPLYKKTIFKVFVVGVIIFIAYKMSQDNG